MRDINRIDKFCEKLAEIWKTNFPDWRFTQFIINFWGFLAEKGDPWWLEEEETAKLIEEYVKSLRP